MTSWQWDFGDGASSTEQNPTHDYTKAGSHTVRLTVSGPGGSNVTTMTEAIKVSPGPLAEVVVSPLQITLQVQNTARLGATALDRFGNEISDALFAWSTLSPAGSIDEAGLFTAGTRAGAFEGAVRVTATRGERVRQASAPVTIQPGPVSRVVVEPSDITLDIGATHSFTFKVFDEFGNEISDATASWSLTAGVGNIDAGGVLTTGTKAGSFPGAIRVEAAKGTDRAAAAADVSIRPDPLATVEVQPPSSVVEKGATQRFTAAGYDRYGNEIPELALRWGATGGQIDAAGLLTAVGRFGRYQVTASATFRDSTATGSAAVEILPVWLPAGDPVSARSHHTATLLGDGKVLIVGGVFTGGVDALIAELYEPATGTFSTTGNMLCVQGWAATATRLADGRVLLTGGTASPRCAQIYDPATGVFTLTGQLNANAGRMQHTATLLADGRVLIAGGEERSHEGPAKLYDSAEIYDPATGTFSPTTGKLTTGRGQHTATLLPTGQVLIIGGHPLTGEPLCFRSTELYDPTTGTFSPTGDMTSPHCGHTATLLDNGKVLVTGGNGVGAELFDPATGSFRPTGDMNTPRNGHTATLLPDGRVLIAGGAWNYEPGAPVPTDAAELYDPETETFTAIDSMGEARMNYTATLLPNGQVLVLGGGLGGVYIPLGSAELLD